MTARLFSETACSVRRYKRVFALVAFVAATRLSVSAVNAQDQTSTHADEILSIHEALLASHLEKNVEGVLAVEADEIVVVSQGEVLLESKKDRTRQFAEYLGHSRFEEYRDVIPPIVRVSEDGTMAWLIAQVRIVEVRLNDKGERAPSESTWAWIELYERRGDRWVRVGEVSSKKPARPNGNSG